MLTESNTNNNVTDTKLQISGTNVTVLSQTHPVTTPPTVSLTSPAPGADVSRQVTLRASLSATAPATVASVQFLLDGQPLGSPVTAAPYTYTWTVGSTPAGDHLLSARAEDSDGNLGTATPVPVVVVQGPPSGGGSGGPGGTSGGGVHSTLKVRVLRWRHGVLTLVVSNLRKHARLSVELEFPHRQPRFVNAPGGRLRLRTPRPRAIVLRVFAGKRRVGKTVMIGLGRSPTVRIINPIANETLSGTVPIVADVTDNVAISSVQFWVDGRTVGRSVTHSPYVIHWRTRGAKPGRHLISVVATNATGNRASAAVVVTVRNPPPPMTCFVLQAHLTAEGHGAATTPALHTAMPGETLLAFVSADGPAGSRRQTASVSGAGVRWKLVERANERSGDSEVWTATAHTILTAGEITATLSNPGFDESLTIIAMEGVTGVGSGARASGTTGAPHLELTTSAATSLVFAVGNDWDRAVPRVLPSGWVPLDQWLDTRTGDTFWSQYTNQPTGRSGSTVAVRVTAPTTDQWNLAAVELVNSGD